MVGGTKGVTFGPFVIRVASEVFPKFRAYLSPPRDMPYEDKKETTPHLNLRHPVSGPFKVPLTR